MPVTVNWGTKVINITQSYLTPLGGSVYELDLNELRLDLKDLEDGAEGMAFPDTHYHNTEVTFSGVTLARVIVFINGYTVTFEDGQYAVEAKGANSNLADVMNLNQVSLRSFNTAGLIVTSGGSPWTQQEKDDLQADMTKLLGLNQQNFRIKDQVFTAYGGQQRLTSGTIRIYPNATDCNLDQNHIAEYTITAEYDGSGNCTSYVVVEA
jgi:hypothetical protein